MKAVRCQHGKLELAEVERPQGDGVRIKVASAGICGSDLHLLDLGMAGTHILGHEFSGVTSNGTPVAIDPMAVCGECPACRSGAYNHCVLGIEVFAMGFGRDGGMAEEVIVPPRCLIRLPSAALLRDACLVEPLGVAVHGISKVALSAADRVAIVGGGAIGLCTVAVAREITRYVALSARHDAQRAAGERLGANANPTGEYDVVIDCAGTSSSMADAVVLCRTGGTIIMLATYWGGLSMPAFEISAKEIRLVASSTYACQGPVRDLDIAAAVLAHNPAIVDAIITHRMPLDAAQEAFAVARDRASGAIKVVLEP